MPQEESGIKPRALRACNAVTEHSASKKYASGEPRSYLVKDTGLRCEHAPCRHRGTFDSDSGEGVSWFAYLDLLRLSLIDDQDQALRDDLYDELFIVEGMAVNRLRFWVDRILRKASGAKRMCYRPNDSSSLRSIKCRE